MEEKSRIQQAMNHIGEAQSFLERAVMELAGVRGMNSECNEFLLYAITWNRAGIFSTTIFNARSMSHRRRFKREK